eukprot:121815-Pelagomonas_calceolata.AAC.1
MEPNTLEKHRQEKANHLHWSPAAAKKKQAEALACCGHESPHAVLGVPENASAAEVRAAFLNLSQLHHPDKPGQRCSPRNGHSSSME